MKHLKLTVNLNEFRFLIGLLKTVEETYLNSESKHNFTENEYKMALYLLSELKK